MTPRIFGAIALVAAIFAAFPQLFGLVATSLGYAVPAPIDALLGSTIERWLVAIGLAAVGAVLLAFGRGRVGRHLPPDEGGGALVPYDPLTAANAPRRRINDRGRPVIVFGVATCAFFFGGLVLWSAFAPLESAAIAPGSVRVERNRLTLDHPDGGTIAELLVTEGARVEAGEVLIKLDPAPLRTRLTILNRRHDALSVVRARLEAEQSGADAVAYPAELVARAAEEQELADLIRVQDALFVANRDAIDSEIEISEQRVRQLRQRIVGLSAQQESFDSQLEIIDSELSDLEELLERGLTQRTRVLQLQREAANLRGRIGTAIAEIAQTESQIGEARLGVVRQRRERLAGAADALRMNFSELLEIEPQIEETERMLSRTELRAPAAGAVFGLRKFTIGGVVRAAEPILEIVPGEANLIIEARIRLTDRDAVTPGMPARVRLTAFSAREVEPVEGELIRIAPDAQTDEATQERFYSGAVAIPEAVLAAQSLRLEPGMPAEVVIPLAARTPIQFLLEPLVRNWDQALREE